MNTSYNGHYIYVLAPLFKKGQAVVWVTMLNGEQVYKVYREDEGRIENLEAVMEEALNDCKYKINMSENESEETTKVEGEEVTPTEEKPTEETPTVEDPAEANSCDSCQ